MSDYERGDDSHYAGGIEPKQYIMSKAMEWWRGQIVKYVSRAGKKPHYDPTTKVELPLIESELVDLGKARFFLDLRVQELKGKLTK